MQTLEELAIASDSDTLTAGAEGSSSDGSTLSEGSIISVDAPEIPSPDIVSIVDSSEQSEMSDDEAILPTVSLDSHAIFSDSSSCPHRLLPRDGLIMMREVRCPVRVLPRHLPGYCDKCMGHEADCTQPCQWVPQYAALCSRRCDSQIRNRYRTVCPMWQMFEINHSGVPMPLFLHHNVSYDVEAERGELIDPYGGLVTPMNINFRDREADREALSSMLPYHQYSDRNADTELGLELLQNQLNTANARYVQYQRTNGTPPSESVTTFVYPLTEHGHAKVINHTLPTTDSEVVNTIEFEWDSDDSHHFIRTDSFFLPGTFVKKSMKVLVVTLLLLLVSVHWIILC